MRKIILRMCATMIAVVCLAGGASAANLLDRMDAADWRKLNVFFSNFCETHLNDFDTTAYDDKALIAFAVLHNVINYKNLFKEDAAEREYYIGKDSVNATIEKYFGIKNVKPQSVEDGFIIYKKDRYYWDDVFEGDPWFAGGQVIELHSEKDGSLSAVVELYKDNEAFQKDIVKINTKDFYAPKKTWKGQTANYYESSGYYAAKIAPHVYKGKKTYKLLQWRKAETLENARKLIGK